MKNPVQKLINAGSKMKHNPPLAQREANSPNKINAFAAQMVIPEQQAMQKSKPIPNPVGSVLMQKLAQAQQAAMASRMPQPSEGGIAQMAAKGGVLKFAGAGKVPKEKKATTTKATPKRTTKRAAPAAKPAEVFPPLHIPTEAPNTEVPMDSMTRRLSEYSVASKHARGTGANPVEPKKGYSLSADPIAEIKENLDKALNEYRNGTKTEGADAQKFLNDLDKLNPSDRAKYADFEEHLHRVNPSEGGPREVPKKIPGETNTQFLQRIRSEGRQADVPPKLADTIAEATKVETPKLGSLPQMQGVYGVEKAFKRQSLGEGIEKYKDATAKQEKVLSEVENLRRIKENVGAPTSGKLQAKREAVSDKARRALEQKNSRLYRLDPLPNEGIPNALVEKFVEQQQAEDVKNRPRQIYEQTKRDIFRNRSIQRDVDAREARKEASANALKTQEGRNQPKVGDTPRVTAESRRQQADILRENNKKSSVIGEKGQVVPRIPASPEQKARRARVSSALGLPEETGIASAASPEARAYMADMAERKKELDKLANKEPSEVKTEGTKLPSKKAKDISREEADARLASAHAEGKARTAQSPATIMGDINDAAHGAIVSNPEWADKIAKASAEFNAKNPNATTSERGAYLKSIAPPEAIEALLGQISPTLEKHGLLFSKEGGIGKPMMEAIDEAAPKATPQTAWNEPKDFKRPAAGPSKLGSAIEGAVNKGAGALQAYSSLAPIANVALDPNKSKADVAREAKYQAVQSNPTIGMGSAIGSGIGESIDKVNELLGRPKTDYGTAFSALGAYGGKGFSGLTRDVMRGKGDESPNLTAKQTLPSVGSLIDTGAEKAKGLYSGIEKAMMDERLPADREREEELQTLLAQEESSRGAPEVQPSGPTQTPQSPTGSAPVIDRTTMSRPGAIVGPAPQSRSSAPVATGGAGAQAPAVKPTLTSAQQEGGIATSLDAPKLPNQQQDMYAGDTSEGTPEGAVQELMKLRGPGYQYSPEVMGMLKDAKEEQQGATLLSMLAQTGAGLANRDRYAGAHDAALLANQAFTSGREREEQAQQQFLQGIIHNEQVPYEMRQHAADTYAKMEMAKAQNAALYGRALLNADTRRYGYDRQAESRTAAQRDQYAKLFVNSTQKEIGQLQRQLATDFNLTDEQKQDISSRIENLSQQVAMARSNMTDQSPVLTGIAGDEGLGQTSEPRLKLDAFN